MKSSVSPKDDIWFLRVCHHISNAFYLVCPDLVVAVSETSYGIRAVAYPGIFFGGVQQIQLRTEEKENGDLGAVAP